jgi:Endonuclease/Exonuclease/phosphatase family/Bacterial TSP3 repeat
MISRSAALLFFVMSTLGQAVEIRVATFNIGAHLVVPPGGGPAYFDYGLGKSGTPDHDSVREILARIDADVVALQEIHTADVTGDDVADLATSLGYLHLYIAPTIDVFDPSLRVAFLSRFPFLTQSSIGPPGMAKDVTRRLPMVKVDVPGTTRDPVLLAAHLKSGSEASDLFQRTVEMRRLTDALNAQSLGLNDNFIVMGDFNLSNSDRTFTALPPSGLPSGFILGADIIFPQNYSTNPLAYFTTPAVNRIIPRQLNGATITFPSSGSTIDLFLVSPVIGGRPNRSEIYNSALDGSNETGLPKAGSPLAPSTSTTASDHYPLFGDFELDAAVPYAFTHPGQTVTESFQGFSGTYDPYPWESTGGTWLGIDNGNSTTRGFRSYGSTGDASLGYLSGETEGTTIASFVNHSTSVLSALQISFTAEQWRSTTAGTSDILSAELIVSGIPQPLPQLAFGAATNLPNGSISGGASTSKTMTLTGLAIAPDTPFQLRFTFTPGAGGGALPADVFINEFSYDNAGADAGEFVEIVTGPGFTGDPAQVVLQLYNGSDGGIYGSNHPLSTFTAGATTASQHRIYSKLVPGIQNGNPDGFALAVSGVVTQFISYGGQIVATDGSAVGLTSTNIGRTQTSTEAVGKASIGLKGIADSASGFSWDKFTDTVHSRGQPNPDQTFTVPPQPQGIAIDNLAVTFLTGDDTDGDGFSDADEVVFGTNPADSASRFIVTIAYQPPTPSMLRLSFQTMLGREYVVESCTDFSDWKDETTFSGTDMPQVTDFPVSPHEPKRFYRVRVTLQ